MIEWQRRHKEQSGQWYHRKYAEQQREYEKDRRASRGHWRQLYPEVAAASDARRRMLVQQARTGEVFSPRDVHARDCWTCRLCWLPIEPDTAWPDPMSPSIDHVIPLSRGGAHSMANVQSAHLGCNSSKGDKLISEVIERLRSRSKSH
ncbi:HNH endonuclease [Streptomyces sp. NPDC002913]